MLSQKPNIDFIYKVLRWLPASHRHELVCHWNDKAQYRESYLSAMALGELERSEGGSARLGLNGLCYQAVRI